MVSSQVMEGILDCIPEAILIVDESGTMVFVNRHATELFGYATAELKGQAVELLLPQRYRLSHIAHRLHFTDALRTRAMGAGLDLFARCKDGTERSVKISLGSVQHGLKTLVVATIRNERVPSVGH